jgi:hypothetical protein
MNEETVTQEVVVPLPQEALEWLERALQWPEDLPAYDRLNKPINGSELGLPI